MNLHTLARGQWEANTVGRTVLCLFLVAKKRKSPTSGSQTSPPSAQASIGGGRFIGPIEIAKMIDGQVCWSPEVDCDDIAGYLAALLQVLGVSCQFVTISTDPKDPLTFTHVYVQAVLEDGTKIPLDPQGPAPGWEPQWIRRKEWPIMTPGSQARRHKSDSES